MHERKRKEDSVNNHWENWYIYAFGQCLEVIKGMEREQTTIRLPSDLKEEIQMEADKTGLAFNQLVLMILKEWLNRQK